jgi:hypothetical protein
MPVPVSSDHHDVPSAVLAIQQAAAAAAAPAAALASAVVPATLTA